MASQRPGNVQADGHRFECSQTEYVSAHHSIGLVAQWITRLPTEQKIPGSNPGKLELFSRVLLQQVTTLITGIPLFLKMQRMTSRLP